METALVYQVFFDHPTPVAFSPAPAPTTRYTRKRLILNGSKVRHRFPLRAIWVRIRHTERHRDVEPMPLHTCSLWNTACSSQNASSGRLATSLGDRVPANQSSAISQGAVLSPPPSTEGQTGFEICYAATRSTLAEKPSACKIS